MSTALKSMNSENLNAAPTLSQVTEKKRYPLFKLVLDWKGVHLEVIIGSSGAAIAIATIAALTGVPGSALARILRWLAW